MLEVVLCVGLVVVVAAIVAVLIGGPGGHGWL